jgi:hypothetical protein
MSKHKRILSTMLGALPRFRREYSDAGLEADLIAMLQNASFDGIPAFVESAKYPRNVLCLEVVLEDRPDLVREFLPCIKRLMPSEKEALKAWMHRRYFRDKRQGLATSSVTRDKLLALVDAIPETLTLDEYPRFCLPDGGVVCDASGRFTITKSPNVG